MAKPPVVLIASPQRSAIERVLGILSPLAAIGGLFLSIRMARRAIKADEEKSVSIDDAQSAAIDDEMELPQP